MKTMTLTCAFSVLMGCVSVDALAQSNVAVDTAHRSVEAPRASIDRIAALIGERYFDAEKAAQIASDLRAEATAGAYDAFGDPRLLADALTRRLRPLDEHFEVFWDGEPPAAPVVAAPTASPPLDEEGQARRSNHGFRSAQILPGGLGYIEIADFPRILAEDAPPRQAADAALAMVANADAVIIDLRENGGGNWTSVGYVAAAFTQEGADIFNTTHGRRGDRSEAPRIIPTTRRLETPLYVLISSRTASAAESFAYTLQSAGRATIIGETSAGAANPGAAVETGTGFSVFVSTGSTENPITHKNWGRVGVQPDIAVSADRALNVAQMMALQRIAGSAGALDQRWALEALTAETRDVSAEYAGTYGDIVIAMADDELTLTRPRRPLLHLRPLSEDLFYVATDLGRRVRFERDPNGRIAGVEQLFLDGTSTLTPRTNE